MKYFKCNNNIIKYSNSIFSPQPNRFAQDITPPPYLSITRSCAAEISQSRSAMPCSPAPLKNPKPQQLSPAPPTSEHQCFWLTTDWIVCICTSADVEDVLLFVMLTARCQKTRDMWTNSTSPTVNTLLWRERFTFITWIKCYRSALALSVYESKL